MVFFSFNGVFLGGFFSFWIFGDENFWLGQVLACLRSIIRKCAYEELSGDDILKLFPPDLPIELQQILLLLLQKYQTQWKEDVSREQVLSLSLNFYHC